jgi:mono/diheme cytochrome c family protein
MIRPLYILSSVVVTCFVFTACTSNPNAPGVEYMPDMYRSPALEAYVDYGSSEYMDWTTDMKEAHGIKTLLSRKPAPGTIPYTSQEMAMFSMPYPLKNTPEDYERAALEIKSPMLSSKENIEKGKDIYTKYCSHCHGAEGHGDGLISKNGHIAGIPDYATKLKDLQEGKMYHSITYGKGLMGQHASQLNQKERWQVIEWVKCLQKGITAPTYDANEMLTLSAVAEAAAPADSTK